MKDSDRAKAELELLERLKDALAGAYFNEDAKPDDVRAFLYESVNTLSIMARRRAGLMDHVLN